MRRFQWYVSLYLLAAIGCSSDSQTADAGMPALGAGSNAVAGAAGTTTSGGSGTAAAGSGVTGAAGRTSVPSGASGTGASGTGAAGAGASGGAAGMMAAGTGGTPEPTAGTGTTAPAAGSGGEAGQPQAGSGGQSAMPAMLGDDQTLIPDASWTCNMPQGIPGPAMGEAVFDIDFEVGEVHDLGNTQYGHRLQIDVSGGKVDGPKLKGELMGRGLDYQLELENGAIELEQIHILTSGASSVYMRNCGVAPGPGNVRVVLDFEAPNASSVSWLNEGTYIGVREFDAAAKKLHMKVYQVTGMAGTANAVKVEKPAGKKNQSWECVKASGSKGEVVYTESVGIGAGSVAVGASKRGTRNIIPITGGTTSGMIAGSVLSGGADYQLSAGGVFSLDARYTLKTSDGELIIVRNCGPVGGLVPVFEAKTDGKYSWVNDMEFLSSDPGIAPGAVNLTIYKKR